MNYQKIVIGRDKKCDLLLTHDSISRKHAELFIDLDGNVFITDLNSKNGTYVNGRRIYQSDQLFQGDTLVVGDKIEVNWLSYIPYGVGPSSESAIVTIPKTNSKSIIPYLIIAASTILAVLYISNMTGEENVADDKKKSKKDEILIVDEDKPLDNREVNVHVEDKNSSKTDSNGSSNEDNQSAKPK